jgi:hypothetical protein
MMQAPVKGLSVLATVGVAVLMVFVLVSGPVTATPVTSTSTPVASWSYGAVKSVSVGPSRAGDGWMYEGNATIGYTVTVYDNNTSATTFELTVLRTMGAAFSLEFCYPSCSARADWVNLTYRAWETTDAVSNFTDQGTVVDGASSVPAIGLLNSSVWVRANLTESSVEHLPELGVGWQVNHIRFLAASIAGHAFVELSPSLGLVPTVLNPGETWSSTSSFQATGEANYSRYFWAEGPRGTVALPSAGSISLSAQGTVTVDGAYARGSTVNFGGVAYPAITLTVIGPFSVREGVILFPSSVDLFGGSSPAWAGNASGVTTVEQSTVDLKPFEDGHLGLAASSWRYVTDSANPADAASENATAAALSPAASSANPVSSTTLQGEPQTAAQADSSQQCLTSGGGCPGVTQTPSNPSPIFGTVVVVGAIASVAALVAVAVVTRYRKLPPPTYLNATLYPPGQAGRAGPQSAPSRPGTPPPPEDDPLDHLW